MRLRPGREKQGRTIVLGIRRMHRELSLVCHDGTPLQAVCLGDHGQIAHELAASPKISRRHDARDVSFRGFQCFDSRGDQFGGSMDMPRALATFSYR